LEHRRALIDLKGAQIAAGQATRERVKASDAALQASVKSARATDDEVKSAQEAATAAREAAMGVRLRLIQGEAAERVLKAQESAERRLAKALQASEGRHRANAREANRLANAVGSATPKAAALQAKLRSLAQTELNMAAHAAALNSVTSAANAASSAVNSVVAALQRASSAPRPSAAPARGRGTTPRNFNPFSKGENSYTSNATGGPDGPARPGVGAGLRRVPLGSPTSLSRIGSAGDVKAERARMAGEAAARKEGKSDEGIRRAGEKRYIQARQATITKLKNAITRRRGALVKSLKAKLKARKNTKVPAPGKKGREKAIDKRQRLTQQIDDIRDELETLYQDFVDLKLEADQLGLEMDELHREDEAEEAEARDEAATAAIDREDAQLDAAVAQAALTAGLGDDLAAAGAVEAVALRRYNEAVASGDPRRIADTARDLLSARQNRESIEASMKNTDAVEENTAAVREATAAFSGAVAFEYRGQQEVIRTLAPPSSDRLTEVAL
ncbi:MAG: hypothetical protein AB7G37_21255, partial [Solirubrobacteraceae bacterium]